ncbi:MAG: MFS transporter [Proteobacteria bacterium]|nr:MAG: MFS transporter [Pseudomonadota bacterium]
MSITTGLVARREIWAWASFDFANSGYTTVVLTAVYNAYFVAVIAGPAAGFAPGQGTLLWTLAIGTANGLALLTAPLLGALADHGAHKKRFLLIATLGCALFTAALGLAGPGEVGWAVALVIGSAFMFAVGENLIAAFLPEIAPPEQMGRISAFGWAIGYVGGVLVLGACLGYLFWARGAGHGAEQYVPVILLIVAVCFLAAALPTFLWLRERAVPDTLRPERFVVYFGEGWRRVGRTLHERHRFRDLFRFLFTLVLYHSGIATVVVLAAVYAQEVMGFEQSETIGLILVVNVTAAVGAFVFGRVQDRLGSLPTLSLTLVIWIAATVLAYAGTSRAGFWVVANLVGIAMGASQSAGRALIGQFTPPRRTAEFFGLWGLAVKLAAIIGPVSYGVIGYLTGGNHRLAILSTVTFFVLGLVSLWGIDEQRGRAAARADS